MITLTIDEATLNATRAALDERVIRLADVVEAQQGITPPASDHCPDCARYVEDHQRALVWNIAALHETKMAQEFYAEVEPGQPEQADPVTAAMAWHDWQAAGPR